MNKDVTKNLLEDTEPRVRSGEVYLPLWLTGLLGLLLYWGCYYVDEHGGRFHELVYQPYVNTNQLNGLKPGGEDPCLALGRMKYQQICMPCHQESGLGVPNQFPPLAGSEWVNAPGFTRIIRIAQTGLTGPVKIKGQEWNLTMPPMGATMTDEELACTLSFVRNNWGNKAPKITPEQVKTVRAALAGSADPQTMDVLDKIPPTD